MFSWKQRLYAVLLKRLLGPYLTAESQQQLYTRIEQISLTEGTYVFTDLSFDTNYISSRIKKQFAFRIISAIVHKIQIDIKLQENGDSGLLQQPAIPSESTSSFAWKALKFSINTAANTNASHVDDQARDGKQSPSTVALLVRIRLEGVTIVMEPNMEDSFMCLEPIDDMHDVSTPSSTKSSYVSSFLEAALASVRLSMEITDVKIQCREAVNNINGELLQRWLEIRIQSLLYYDVRDPGSSDLIEPNEGAFVEAQRASYETIVHKAVEVTRLTALTGTHRLDAAPCSDPIVTGKSVFGLLDGSTCCSLRVIEYKSESSSAPTSFVQGKMSNSSTEHDIQITMNQKLNLSVDVSSLQLIRAVVNSYISPSNCSSHNVPTQSMIAASSLHHRLRLDIDEDDSDYKTLEGIMAQYQDARLLVKKKEVRGGILVPSVDEGGDITFDAFFDANEHSYLPYSSVLRDSLFGSMLYDESKQQPSVHLVRAKFTLHLQEGGIKLSFPSVCENTYLPDEYVLLAFNDVNLASQISSNCTEYSFSIQHIELEDGMLARCSGTDTSSALEVGTVLRFAPCGNFDDDDDEMDVLIGAPCVAISFKINSEDTRDIMAIEVVMEPLEIAYRIATITKLVQFLQTDVQHNPAVFDTMKPKHKSISLTGSCSSLTVLLPVTSEQDWKDVYERSGYFAECVLVRDPALGFCCEQLSLELCQTDDVDKQNEASLSCHSIIAFVSCPVTKHKAFDYTIYRTDFLTISGLTEDDLCISATVHFTPVVSRNSSLDDGNCRKTLAQSLFPSTPSLSSFKTRQEDDDDEKSIGEQSCLEGRWNLERNCGDAQAVMLFDAAYSDVVVAVKILEIVVDISAKEVWALHEMILFSLGEANVPSVVPSRTHDNVPQKQIACAISCDCFSFSLHVDGDSSDFTSEHKTVPRSSFRLTVEEIKGYCIAVGSSPKHLRFSAYDFNLLEVFKAIQQDSPRDVLDLHERIHAIRQRGLCRLESKAVPIVYRSYLFAPISPKSPSFLLDCLYLSSDSSQDTTRTIYASLYNITYRHDYDSKWMTRLCSTLPQRSANSSNADAVLLRVFLSATDCIFDYSSLPRFNTASRILVRVGDMRISSNLVTPRVSSQAISFSVGDVELLVCSSRFPYNFDNSRLFNASATMKPDEISLKELGLLDDAESNDVLRCMNYRTMLSMAFLEALVVISTGTRTCSEPSFIVTLTVGQIFLLACKDSFALLMASISEASAEMTALTVETFESLKLESTTRSLEKSKLSVEETGIHAPDPGFLSEIPNSFEKSGKSHSPRDFLLDGYDWTAIDSDEMGKPGIPSGDEQSARWYGESGPFSTAVSSSGDPTIATVNNEIGNDNSVLHTKSDGPPIITHHFQLHPVADPISDGDMGAVKYTGSNVKPQVQTRVIVQDLAIRIRFFDGYDWPELLDAKEINAPHCDFFLIPEVKKSADDNDASVASSEPCDGSRLDRKSKLLGDLLSDSYRPGGTFDSIPLPEDQCKRVKEQAELRRLARRTSKFFQIEFSGVVARLDSMEDCIDHRLVSCLNLNMRDFFLAETISTEKAVKMIGEWFNEHEHPRDSKDGLILMKMVTWHPLLRVTPKGEVANDESDVAIKILPLRCIVDQRAVAFVRAFFSSVEGRNPVSLYSLPPHLHAVPPPLFTMFRVQPLKLKVDYRPQKLDTKALRNGDVVELINLSPLDGMVLTLKSVDVVNEIGFGSAIFLVVRRWVEDICATQLHKFVTKSRALEPFTEVSHAATDIVVLPWEAFRNGESIQKALRAGTRSFSKAVMYEVFNTTSRVADFVGSNVSRIAATASTSANMSQRTGGNLLPTRPTPMPRSILETGPHAVESLSRGLQEATYTVVIVPYREYHRAGATGAVQSVIKGIPVAIVAPTSGVAEALSYTLLGARNQIRPDIRKEDEASLRGLHAKT